MTLPKKTEISFSTSGISPGFPELSQIRGLVTHVLLTRTPLSSPKGFSFDLHVLGPPQTFALSQDQTLQFESFPALAGLSHALSRVSRQASLFERARPG